MACASTSHSDEADLARVLAGFQDGDPAYAAVLSDLGVVKLNKVRNCADSGSRSSLHAVQLGG